MYSFLPPKLGAIQIINWYFLKVQPFIGTSIIQSQQKGNKECLSAIKYHEMSARNPSPYDVKAVNQLAKQAIGATKLNSSIPSCENILRKCFWRGVAKNDLVLQHNLTIFSSCYLYKTESKDVSHS